jgi:hemolysin III
MAATRVYSRAEHLSDAAVHLTGLVLTAGSVPVLIVLAAMLRGDAASVAGVSVYAATLALMLGASAVYNMAGPVRWSGVLKRIDHACIYLKIAGTYTPFLLIAGQGWGLLATVWAGALAGAGLKAFAPDRFRWLGLALYLGLGWAGVIAGGALFAALPGAAVVLMLVGGLIYTAGVGFFLMDRMPFHNTVWHGFVLVASGVFYAAVTVAVVAG